MKNIILGMFDVIYGHNLEAAYQCSAYPFKKLLDRDMFHNSDNIIDVVSLAISRCDKCYFVLDNIVLPINNGEHLSYTCKELEFILEHPYLLDKVQFLSRGNEISQKKVLEYLGRTDLITKN